MAFDWIRRGRIHSSAPYNRFQVSVNMCKTVKTQLVPLKHLMKLREKGHDQSPQSCLGLLFVYNAVAEILHTAILIPNSLWVIVGIGRSRLAGGLLLGGVAQVRIVCFLQQRRLYLHLLPRFLLQILQPQC